MLAFRFRMSLDVGFARVTASASRVLRQDSFVRTWQSLAAHSSTLILFALSYGRLLAP